MVNYGDAGNLFEDALVKYRQLALSGADSNTLSQAEMPLRMTFQMVLRNAELAQKQGNTPTVVQIRKCIHLGKALDTTVKVACTSCGGNKPMLARVYECAVTKHGRCLPNFTPNSDKMKQQWLDRKPESDLYALCYECPLKQLEQNDS